MTYMICQKSAFKIVGIPLRTSIQTAAVDIKNHWDRFYSEDILNQIPHKASDEIFGLYYDYEGDYTKPYSLLIGCKVDIDSDHPSELVATTVPASKYAHYRAVGQHPQALIKSWQEVWNQKELNRRYTFDYELYNESFLTDSQKVVELFIAI